MLSSYLKICLRIILREKSYFWINTVGLSSGIACCLIIGLYLHSELNYDKHYAGQEYIVRVGTESNNNGSREKSALSSSELGPLLARDFIEVEDYVRFMELSAERYLLRVDDNALYWEDVYIADDNLFEVFDHEVLFGDPATALVEPSNIAISESLARAYFGDENPLGRRIQSNATDFTISLVYADQPANTHLRYDAILSFNFLPSYDDATILQMLWNLNVYTYLVMHPAYQPERFDQISQTFYGNNMATIGTILQDRGFDSSWSFFIEPLADIHLRSTTSADRPRGNLLILYSYIVIAGFVLIIACFNYINLATARSSRRAREIGIRKVIGANRKQLIGQFAGESVFFSLVSLGLALILVELVLSFTSLTSLLGVQLSINVLFAPSVLTGLLFSSILLGIVTGVYPAFYLSSVLPAAALKNEQPMAWRRIGLRQLLVMLQFTISIAVMASTLLLLQQMNFVSSKSLGFQKQNKLLVRVQGVDQIEKMPVLINELNQYPSVIAAASSRQIFGEALDVRGVRVEDNAGVMAGQVLNRMYVQAGFLGVTGLELIRGRDFEAGDPTDGSASVIVNQALVKAMEWDSALGKVVQYNALDTEPKRVIGVVEDFNYEGLQSEIQPVIMTANRPDFASMSQANRNSYAEWLIVNVEPGKVPETIDLLQQMWGDFDPLHPFEFSLLDDMLDQLYGSEERQIGLIALFSSLCLFISCLGLYGLSAFTTLLRTKEIGVRKVFGASTSGLIFMLFKNIAILIILASVLASVISFWAVEEWLQGFNYRIDLSGFNLMNYVVATMLATGVAFATMAAQSYKTAQANPVIALRYE